MQGIPVFELSRELLAIAEEGLRRQAVRDQEGRDERIYLESLSELVSAGRSPADLTVQRWGAGGNRELGELLTKNSFPNGHIP